MQPKHITLVYQTIPTKHGEAMVIPICAGPASEIGKILPKKDKSMRTKLVRIEFLPEIFSEKILTESSLPKWTRP